MDRYRGNAIPVLVPLVACTATGIASIAPLGSTLDGSDHLKRLAPDGGGVAGTVPLESAWTAAGAEAAGFCGAGAALLAAALLHHSVLHRTRLVPRRSRGWGLAGAALGVVAAVSAAFTRRFGFSPVDTALNLPIGLQEMVLAAGLPARGFDPASADLAAHSLRAGHAARRTAPTSAYRTPGSGVERRDEVRRTPDSTALGSLIGPLDDRVDVRPMG